MNAARRCPAVLASVAALTALSALAAPCLADEPASAASKPQAAPSASAPVAPSADSPAKPSAASTSAAPTSSTYPGAYPRPYTYAPQGYAPYPSQGYMPYAPQGYMPYPPQNYAAPGYAPGPVYVDGAKDSDYEKTSRRALRAEAKRAAKAREEAEEAALGPDARVAKSRKRTGKLLAIGGIGAFGISYIASVAMAAVEDITSIECHHGSGWDFIPTCQKTESWTPMYIPVAGPFLALGSSETHMGDGEKVLAGALGVLQVGGLVTSLAGLIVRGNAPSAAPAPSSLHTLAVVPSVSTKGAGLSFTGTF